jgi:hypothetical protein
MKKLAQNSALIILFVCLSSFAVHKFYVSIYQINYVPQKKMVQITSRIFIDDMNEALEKKFHKKTYVGTDRETDEDVVLMKKYLAEKFTIKINGTAKPLVFLSKEVEANVIVSYHSIKDISKITSFSIENTALLEVNEEQQNIIQANISGEKQSLLLTADNYKGMLK